VKVRRVQFAAQQKAPRFIPAERRAIVATVLGKGPSPKRCR
jgi:hypothetical protein